MPDAKLHGVGLGLRYDFIDDVLEGLEEPATLEPIRFFEIAPENYMRRGGYFARGADRIGERFPLLTHGLTLSIGGTDPFDAEYMSALKGYVDRTSPPFHSDHLCFSGARGRVFHDLLPLPLSLASARHASARIREAADRLERPLLVENITHYLVPGATRLEEADFIGEVLASSGARLLLDVNNVYVNARNYGFDPYEFLRKIPLDRADCLHVAGHTPSAEDELIIDSHGAGVEGAVLEMLSWVVARTGPIPVVLERDHHIPTFSDLLVEVRRIDAAYRRGLESRAPIPHVAASKPSASTASGGAVEPVVEMFDRVVRGHDADLDLAKDARSFLAATGLDGADVDALARLTPKRLALYRKLVRKGISRAIRMEIPRTAARLGDLFDEYVTRFLDDQAPRSHQLRDAAFELAAWAAPLFANDPRVPSYIADLARHELSDLDVAAAESREVTGTPVDLERRVAFDASVRLHRYDHAIHELEAVESARDVPRREPTALLAYRDEDDDVRYLALTPLAARVVERLMARDVLREAVVASAAELGFALDDGVLSSIAAVLQDLEERGALLGGEGP